MLRREIWRFIAASARQRQREKRVARLHLSTAWTNTRCSTKERHSTCLQQQRACGFLNLWPVCTSRLLYTCCPLIIRALIQLFSYSLCYSFASPLFAQFDFPQSSNHCAHFLYINIRKAGRFWHYFLYFQASSLCCCCCCLFRGNFPDSRSRCRLAFDVRALLP